MSQQKPPNAPDLSKAFGQGIKDWLKYLPKMLNAEEKYRRRVDPGRIESQQALQEKYGPIQYRQQREAIQQLDPTGYGLREGLGAAIGKMLGRGNINPQQASIYDQLGRTISANLARGGVSPTQIAGYETLGEGARGEYLRGRTRSPEQLRQDAQGVRAAQSARGNVYGNAPVSAEALYGGNRGEELFQRRTGNLQNFLGLRAPELDALQGAFGYQGLQTPEEKALAQAGSFLSLPGPIQQAGQIQGVNPDRSFAYANPNSPYMRQQGELTNFANQFAGYNPTNPWMNALGGVASGAAAGGTFGGGNPYAIAGGALLGGVGGYFGSDPKMKTDVKKVGNVPIYEYKYKPKFGISGTFRGPMSTDVKKLDSGAVQNVLGYDFVRSPNSLGLNRVKVKEE